MTEEKGTSVSCVTPIVCGTQQAKPIVCEVCGYQNPPDTGICNMCSNYLEEMKVR